MKLRLFLLVLLALTGALGERKKKEGEREKAEVLWDEWGVPHIFADSLSSLSYGFGYAHGRDHGRLMLELCFLSSGRAAELEGLQYVPLDRFLHSNRLPQAATLFYDNQDPETVMIYDFFADGFNHYAETHPQDFTGPFSSILPLTGKDVFQANLRVLYTFAFADSGSFTLPFKEQYGEDPLMEERLKAKGVSYGAYEDHDPFKFLDIPKEMRELIGSNAWAINSRSRRSDGKPKLNQNPHLPYFVFFRWYEAQLTCKSCDIDVYGANLVGIPNLQIAFNDHVGWTHTVNPGRPFTGYVVDLASKDSYYFDDEILKITTEEVVFRIKTPFGYREEKVINEFTIHGQIIARAENQVLVKRLAGFDDSELRPDAVKQWWAMGKAKSMKEFKDAMRLLQVPMFYTVAASKDDDILFNFNGWVPERKVGDYNYWGKAVNGSISEHYWDKVLPWDELPTLENPESGYVQNANESPWSATLPVFTLNPDNYAPYITRNTAGVGYRPQVSLRMMETTQEMTFETFAHLKHSTAHEAAHHCLPDLVQAVRDLSDSPLLLDAALVLDQWDWQMDVDSVGAILFQTWLDLAGSIYVNPWSPDDPLNTPNTLANPKKAVEDLEKAILQLKEEGIDIRDPFGKHNRLFMGPFQNRETVPGNGCASCFRNSRFIGGVNLGGDSWTAIVEWDENGARAESLIGYGNASPHSAGADRFGHVNDQNALYSEKKLKPVWRKREEIESHLEEYVELFV